MIAFAILWQSRYITMKSLKAITILAILVVLSTALAMSGCTSPTATPTPTAAPTATPTPAAGPTILAITGMVNTPLNLTLDDLNGYPQHYAAWQNNAGNNTYNGTGPYILDLLNKTGLKSGAANITFASTDPAAPFSNTITLADLNSKYSDSIIAYNWTGLNKQGKVVTNANKTLQMIVPSGGGKNQVQNINQITVS